MRAVAQQCAGRALLVPTGQDMRVQYPFVYSALCLTQTHCKPSAQHGPEISLMSCSPNCPHLFASPLHTRRRCLLQACQRPAQLHRHGGPAALQREYQAVRRLPLQALHQHPGNILTGDLPQLPPTILHVRQATKQLCTVQPPRLSCLEGGHARKDKAAAAPVRRAAPGCHQGSL